MPQGSTTKMTYRRKLIEVDLPLDAINQGALHEKNAVRIGHPSQVHTWWARRPLLACRAVIFASMVDDPEDCDEYPDRASKDAKRRELHGLIAELVKWENSNDEGLLARARREIALSVARSRGDDEVPEDAAGVLAYLRDNAPTVHDPFCGGGSIPLEAQRLGLKAVGSDLNPVAVLITKALIELPPKFAGRAPINPDADPMGMMVGKGRKRERVPWRGAAGLADDIRYYGKWMRDEAFKRIGHLYPQVSLEDGSKATVIAWLWARTVPCANPACGIAMPMMKTFQLSKKRGNEHWVRPVVDRDAREVRFVVQDHDGDVPKSGTVNRNGATCLACGNTVKLAYVREQARAGRMGEQMTAIVADGKPGRKYIQTHYPDITRALSAEPQWQPNGRLPHKALGIAIQNYGFTEWNQLYSNRQLLALTTMSEVANALKCRLTEDNINEEYVNAMIVFLSFALSKYADFGSSFATWHVPLQVVRNIFARQAIPIIWDFAEANLFSDSSGNWLGHVERIAKVIANLPRDGFPSKTYQKDASEILVSDNDVLFITDPPYYDNIGYADLSDFFYVWLRPLLRDVYPDLFGGILTPKEQEIVAAPRFQNPRQRFEDGLLRSLRGIRSGTSIEHPSSMFYAYKQQEETKNGRRISGWETMLNALVASGFCITRTWPMRTESSYRPRSHDSNALASSVAVIVRPRPISAEVATRQEFLDELETDLPLALDRLTRDGHIAPADLPQSAIGPGMQIYSKYSRVETISGDAVSVREALQEINRVIGEYFDRQEGELDGVSRFCVRWVKSHGYGEGAFGDAENIARAMNIAVSEISEVHGLAVAERGSVELYRVGAYGPGRKYGLGDVTAWEGCMRMAYHLDTGNEDGEGVAGCAKVARAMSGSVDSVERLARILYNHWDGSGNPREAYIYNQLVSEWQTIMGAAREAESPMLIEG